MDPTQPPKTAETPNGSPPEGAPQTGELHGSDTPGPVDPRAIRGQALDPTAKHNAQLGRTTVYPKTAELIDRNFKYHSVGEPSQKAMANIREACKALALEINAFCPDSREKSVAITKLEEVMFWTNAGIARCTS